MNAALDVRHLKRYAAIGKLLYRHGRDDWVQKAGLDAILREAEVETPGDKAKAEQLAEDLEKLGPTFVKLGQLLSSRTDLLPPAYLEALSRLQDDVEPFPYERVDEILFAELGIRVSKAFSEFDEKPLAAASLGQVHVARLRDGRRVAVKIQRPDVREAVFTDFEALETIADLLDKHTDAGRTHGFLRHLEELRKNVYNELDYRREMENLIAIRRNMAEFERIAIPAPIEGYCTSRVLTMEHMTGTKITSLSPVVLLEVDRTALARELFNAYLKQVLVDGIFHADPHPGNVLLTEDGRIVLLDLGLVAKVTPQVQQYLMKMLLAISEGRGEDAAEEAIQMAESEDRPDRATFKRLVSELVAKLRDATVSDIQVGRVVLEIQHVSDRTGYRLPTVFTMIGKMLLNLDRVAKILDPSFDPNAAIRDQSIKLISSRARQSFTRGATMQTLMEAGEFVQKLPQRLNRGMDMLLQKEWRVHVDGMDEEHLLKGIHKVANRITAGLVLAALIVGAALIMRVPTSYQWWGYPPLALVLFAGAAGGGLILIFRILLQDHRHEQEVSKSRKRD